MDVAVVHRLEIHLLAVLVVVAQVMMVLARQELLDKVLLVVLVKIMVDLDVAVVVVVVLVKLERLLSMEHSLLVMVVMVLHQQFQVLQ